MPRRIDPSRNIGLEPSNNSTHDTNTMSFTKLQHNVEVTYQLLALFPHRIKTIQDARMEVQHNCQAAKKIADAKLATDFQTILKEFQKAQRLAVEREAAYAPFFFSSRSAIETSVSEPKGSRTDSFKMFTAISQRPSDRHEANYQAISTKV
ncbi:uncharacterized protein LOC120700278 isoform X3 [Panicum virgatum]|uniref:uncharacterized protein LOC120700278 isoform X3 n=1 Tax=Panicum virgatum TaxID=38727 RepID=UPI0019D4F950|nr:uncharacterized protein LOC120700278 isoform X3 [Panicum virgatum]